MGSSFRNRMAAVGTVLFRMLPAAFLCGCAVSCVSVSPRPGWVRTGKSDDGLYRYRLGTAERAASEADAREAAYRDASEKMRLDLPAPLSAKPGEKAEFRQTIRVPDGAYAEKCVNGWNAWVLAGFERAELESVRGGIEQGNALAGQWAELMRLKGQSRYAEAEALAARMTAGYGDPLFPPVSMEVLRQEGRRLTDLKEEVELQAVWRELESARRGGDWAGARQRLATLESRTRSGLTLPYDSGVLRTLAVKIDREERGALLSGMWERVMGLERSGDAQGALVLARQIQGEAAQADGLRFSLEELDLKTADLLAGLGRPNEARSLYEALAEKYPARRVEMDAQLAKLPPAPKAWPLKARWKGGPVALFCVVREKGAIRPFPELAGNLAGEFSKAEMLSVDLCGRMDSTQLAAFFERGETGGLSKAAEAADARVILTVLYDVGPAPPADSLNIVDTRVRFSVRRPNGAPAYEDQFKGVSGGLTPSRWAENTAGTLLDNRPDKYLIPKAPPL